MRSAIVRHGQILGLVVLLTLGLANQARAQIGVGIWARTDAHGNGMTMTVEVCCNGGRRLIYRIPSPGQPVTMMTVDSPMNGTEVPALVNGQPSGSTMAITRVD